MCVDFLVVGIFMHVFPFIYLWTFINIGLSRMIGHRIAMKVSAETFAKRSVEN